MKQASDQNLQLGKWLGGAALGAAVMYLMDPDRGAPRRALSGEKLRRLGRQTGDVFDKVMHGVGTHSAEVAQALRASGSALSDGVDADHAPYRTAAERSDLYGRQDNPSSASAGSVLQQGADSMQRTVDNTAERLTQTRAHAGEPARSGSRIRGASLAGASVLGLGGLMAPRSPVGMAMGLAGLALLVSATRGGRQRPMRGNVTHAAPVQVEKTIRIDAAPEQVFDMFANYENFPRFMANVLEVRDLGNRRSHWVVRGPAGSHFAWNAVLTEHRRPHRLAWESEPGAEVEQSGAIEFEPIHNGTRVTVRMTYRPPAGAVGRALATLLGRDPKRQMDEDLARMKDLVERGAMTQANSRTGASQGKFLH